MRTLIDFADPHGSPVRLVRGAFGTPRDVLVARHTDEVLPLLDAVQAHALAGRWCVGYLRYEAARAFDPALATHAADGPLAWFGVHDAIAPWPDDFAHDEPALHWHARQERMAFDAHLARIQQAIAAGEIYQLNYTAPLTSAFGAGAPGLFAALHRAQPQGYCAFIDTGEEQVLSVSPELFFHWQDGRILLRPMKGTAARGVTPEQDEALAQQLRDSAKERAENVMIVDLVRNDVSRIAERCSVQVPRLFALQALPTVWQMVSDVQARTRPGTSLGSVFAALFPCGSVTGAPKVRAMELIQTLEPAPRGVYCGAVGVVRPGGAATFNVPIRTVQIRGHEARCGIGSGITAGATAAGEWQEWRNKRAFLERASQQFELLETFALHEGQPADLAAHLARMHAAALHFNFVWQPPALKACVDALVQAHRTGSWRVRLLLDARGRPRAEAVALLPQPSHVRLQLATTAFEAAHSEFVRFKTTRRAHYEAFAPVVADVYDTVLWNARGELTECTRGNLAVLLDGHWRTPPLHCGLLGGVGRARLLREGRITEAVVRREDLARAQGLAFINSLRGWVEASLS